MSNGLVEGMTAAYLYCPFGPLFVMMETQLEYHMTNQNCDSICWHGEMTSSPQISAAQRANAHTCMEHFPEFCICRLSDDREPMLQCSKCSE